MSRVLELLLGAPMELFREGRIAFLAPWPTRMILWAGAIACAACAISYWMRSGPLLHRVFCGALRALVLCAALLLLAQPTLLVSSVAPQRNFLAVLIDDSRSMTISGEDGETRAEKAEELLGEGSPLLSALREDFNVKFFRFSQAAGRAPGVEDLDFAGGTTAIADALESVRRDMEGVPLSGIVLVSDGGDNAATPIGDALLSLRARDLPVFAIGLGDEEIRRDARVARVDLPRRALAGTFLTVNARIEANGYEGRKVELVAEDEGRIVASEEVALPARGEALVVPLAVTLEHPGSRHVTVRIAGLPGERVTENNEVGALVDVRARREKILYFEGEPRWEVAFMRRAVKGDENLQLVVLQRTAENKFLRLGVTDSTELIAGFPKTREELFGYRALILGSVEASFFTHDQLAMISEFVSMRGGSLLALGARRAFAEGGYAGTPVEDILPVVLEEVEERGREGGTDSLLVSPTPAGRGHPATRIAGSASDSEERWRTLPPVLAANRITQLKPGATALLEGAAFGERGDAGRVVLAHQRYGRGRAIALGVHNTWRWRMDASVALEDASHRVFWRQLLRWAASDPPDRIEVVAGQGEQEVGEPAKISVTVEDEAFQRVNGARALARITDPSGEVSELPLEWSVEEDGLYEASFVPKANGAHQVEVEIQGRGGEDAESARSAFRAAPGTREYRRPEQRRALLERIARETDGRYYAAEDADRIATELSHAGVGVTMIEEHDLWDTPAALLLIGGLLVGEWFLRRRRGLA